MAFGDSITAGTVTTFNGLLRITIAPQSYPYKLKDLLADRHADQQIEVYNEGSPNEWAADGVTRLPERLTEDSPQVLLLLEGVNDINSGAGVDDTIANLQTMIGEAHNRGLVVFVGTLLPQRAGSQRAYAPGLIQPFNEQLKAMVAANDATLVDLYTPFAADLSLLGPDGLHPTAAGYTKMAEIWADAIDEVLEAPVTTVKAPRGARLR
jgi:lysophospholipase L1-like esterase